ncbi:MAG: hypothetical protein REI12_02065 [Pedobacter sp.]|nr:hypothetical protein [Pedobacter sp.]
MKHFFRAGFSVLLLLAPMTALACGACIEDKMAATYDYDAVQKAHAQKRTVVFCDVQDRIAPEKLRQAVASTRGIDPGSIRISSEPAALSFALDTRTQSPAAAVASIASVLKGKVRLSIIRNAPPGQ